MDVSVIDAFFADAKKLRGDIPSWQESPRPGEHEATWSIEDSLGVVSAQLRFRCARQYLSAPSISIVVRGQLVGRLDLEQPGIQHRNPPDASKYGLPPVITGSHIHGWPDNRDYVIANERFGQLPYRRPIPAQVRKLPQAILWLGSEINLTVGPDQRGFDVPAQSSLF